MLNSKSLYRRILIKLSGEALMGDGVELFDSNAVTGIMQQIKDVVDCGIGIGIVIGGGNIIRGNEADKLKLDRINVDYMGMLSTIINAIALKDFLSQVDIGAVIYSSIGMGNVIKSYNREDALKDLNNDNVVIFAGGTGNPLFTTDSAAALRAIEINADLIIKATKVDGVYDSDPKMNPSAKKYNHLSFLDAINKNLKIMDLTAFDLCKNHGIDIHVCNIFTPNTLKDVIYGEPIGTLIYSSSLKPGCC